MPTGGGGLGRMRIRATHLGASVLETASGFNRCLQHQASMATDARDSTDYECRVKRKVVARRCNVVTEARLDGRNLEEKNAASSSFVPREFLRRFSRRVWVGHGIDRSEGVQDQANHP